ncbi:MAG: UPF0104 family protein [Hyphomicrobiales bacterium]|nr:UPF0104 family protein [Hyphomicrobiales bacterium]
MDERADTTEDAKTKPGRLHPRWHVAGIALSLVIVGASLWILGRTLATANYAAVREAVAATADSRLVFALLATAASYLALTGYDALALRHLKIKVGYPRTALASFASYAVAFTLGFPMVTAAAVRFWVYGPAGVGPAAVARLTLVAGLTFWLGMGAVTGLGLLLESAQAAAIDHLPVATNLGAGAAILLLTVAYVAYVAGGRRRVTLGRFRVKLPGVRVTLGQMALGVLDLGGAAGALYALLPPGHGLGYPTFVAIYAFASIVGIASNAPGGIGVFEATMLRIVPAAPERMLASLLLFRLCYYALPFVLALASLGALEARRRWAGLRAAVEVEDDDGG